MIKFDPYSLELSNNPYLIYKQLRDEAPLYKNEQRNIWVLSRHKDVEFAMKNPQVFSNADGSATMEKIPEQGKFILHMSAMDPPNHKHARALASKAFNSTRIAEMEEAIREVVSDTLNTLSQNNNNQCDFVQDFSEVIPISCIAKLIGISAKNINAFKTLSNRVASRDDSSPQISAHSIDAMMKITQFLAQLVKKPALSDSDLISTLVNTELEGKKMPLNDVVGFLFLLSAAGNDTTNKLLGSALYWLHENPEQQASVINNRSLVSNWIEETMRFESPSQIIYRTINEEIELHGQTLIKGDRVALLIGSANRDERIFENPEKFDIKRNTRASLAFGRGIHHCLGAAMAKLICKVSLNEILDTISMIEFDNKMIKRPSNSNTRGFSCLPMSFKRVEESSECLVASN